MDAVNLEYPRWLYSANHASGVLVPSLQDLPGLPPGETWFTSPALTETAFPIDAEIAKIPPTPMTVQAMTAAILQMQAKQVVKTTDSFPTAWSPEVPESLAFKANDSGEVVDKRTKAYRESQK